ADERRELPRIIDLVRRIPEWVDAPRDAKGMRTGRPGLVDAVVLEVARRWRSADVQPLRDLRPRAIVDMLAAPDLRPGSAEADAWLAFRRGVGALLFTPMPSRLTGEQRALGRSYHLHADEWQMVKRLFEDLGRLRLDDALPLLDDIAANLD